MYLKSKGIYTVLHSGNITPVLMYYQELLKIDSVFGTNPRMEDKTILGIEIEDFGSSDFKVKACRKVIEELGLKKSEIVAIGDSPADKGIFELAGYSIAINPKGDIAQYADTVIGNDLKQVIPIVENLLIQAEMHKDLE
ncbi:MAG TPA: hypothetical protein DCP90_07790 [Clostridiales bacterium]|nr:MAG: hypothetical protein A2Y22_05985 [Clostridiales bacterium GWD2_32_59]HAN10500.1 hypothetical protein [Clostridiales bacterium]